MKALGVLFANLFGALFGFLTKYFVAGVAFKITVIAIMLTLAGGMYSLMRSCSEGICSSAINSAAAQYPTFGMGLGIAFNTTTYSAVSIYLLVWTSCQLYVMKKKVMNMITETK